MKKMTENRYPNAAVLFRFCKEALALRYEGNVKVIDQDVGAILGYDPADCSHWKKGKKNIRSLSTFKSIAEHLRIDESILIDIVAGKIDLEEAVFEYKGYGNFSAKGPSFDALRKDFFKAPERWQKDGHSQNFEEIFQLHKKEIAKTVERLIKRVPDQEAPTALPELLATFPSLSLQVNPAVGKSIQTVQEGDATVIYVQSLPMRPYVRFLVAKALFTFLCEQQDSILSPELGATEEIREVQANIFAGMLLVPHSLLKKEAAYLNCATDFIPQLADRFCVSKSLMTQQFREYLKAAS